MEEWMIPSRFTVGVRQGLTREDIAALAEAARVRDMDPRVLAARLIAEGLRRLGTGTAPVPDGNVTPGRGWGYPLREEG